MSESGAQPRQDARPSTIDRCARTAATLALRRTLGLVAGILLLTGLAGHAAAQAPDRSESPAARPNPRIGLVLSGGGARGLAHIGVLKVLDELRVPIDCIAGTSMGGIVGAIYATGVPIEEMESRVRAIDWKSAFQDRPNRSLMTARRKQEESGYLARPEFGFRDGELQTPRGLLYGQSIEALFADLAPGGYGTDDFTKLPFPFKAVATDIATGTPVVLEKGSLVQAMRATMSIPGVMAPVQIDGQYLLDGGLVQNLPVQVAREMCADVVIAVNLGTPLLKPSEVTSLFTVSAQMINILTEQNVRASLASLGPRDILVAPQLGDIGAGSFDRADAAIAAGAAATRLHEHTLRGLALPAEQYRARLAARRSATRPELAADEVRVAPTRRVNPAVLAADIRVEPGEPAGLEDIERSVQQIYSRGDFETVGVRMLRDGDRRIALIEPIEKAWGPHYLRFGLSLYANVGGEAGFTLLARSNQTWLNRLGAEWVNQVQIGQSAGFLSEFFQPLGVGSPWFVAPRARYLRDDPNIYLGDSKLATYQLIQTRVGIDLGRQFGTLGEARVGLLAGRSRFEIDVGIPGLPATSNADNGWTARVDLDKLDSFTFPTTGQRARFDLFAPTPSLGADSRYTRAQFEWVGASTWRNNTLAAEVLLGGGLGSGAIPGGDSFTLGGFQRLSGYDYQRFRAEGIAFGSLNYRRVIRPPLGLELGGIVDRVYAGASLEAARLRRSFDPATPDDNYYSGSLYLAADTALGPMFIAYGQGLAGNWTLWFSIGRSWAPR